MNYFLKPQTINVGHRRLPNLLMRMLGPLPIADPSPPDIHARLPVTITRVEVSAARKQIPEPDSERTLERPCTVRARTVLCMQLAALTYDQYYSVVYYYTFVSIPNRWASSPLRLHIKKPE